MPDQVIGPWVQEAPFQYCTNTWYFKGKQTEKQAETCPVKDGKHRDNPFTATAGDSLAPLKQENTGNSCDIVSILSRQTCYEYNSFSHKRLILLWILLNISLPWFPAALNSLLNTHKTVMYGKEKKKKPLGSLISSYFPLLKLNNHSLSSPFLHNNHKYATMPEVIYSTLP